MLAVLGSSPIAFEILEETAAMSGPTAAGDVARALARLCGRGAEVIVIARGGGALCRARTCPPRHLFHLARCRAPPSVSVPADVSRKEKWVTLETDKSRQKRTERRSSAGAVNKCPGFLSRDTDFSPWAAVRSPR